MTISNLVREILEKRPEYLLALELGIGNNSAVARKILPAVQKKFREATFQSVMAAVRRYAETVKPKDTAKIEELFRKSRLRIRSKVAVITLKASPTVFKLLEKISTLVERDKGEVMNTIHGSSMVTLIIDQTRRKQIETIAKDHLIDIKENLTEITIISPPDIEEIPGVIARLTNILSMKKINLIELLSCYTDTILIVSEDQTTAAYQLLTEITEK